MRVLHGLIGPTRPLFEAARALAAVDGGLSDAERERLAELEHSGVQLAQDGAPEAGPLLRRLVEIRADRGALLDADGRFAALRCAVLLDQSGDGAGAADIAGLLDHVIAAAEGTTSVSRLEPLSLMARSLAPGDPRGLQVAHACLAIFIARDGDDSDAAWAGRATVAEAHFHTGDAASAGAVWSEVHAALSARHGADHDDALDIEANLAVVAKVRGDLRGARATEERLLALRKARHGDDHPRTLGTAHNLAGTLIDLGEVDAGLALAEATYDRLLATQGPGSDDTHLSLQFLAAYYAERGDEERLQRVLERLQAAGAGEE